MPKRPAWLHPKIEMATTENGPGLGFIGGIRLIVDENMIPGKAILMDANKLHESFMMGIRSSMDFDPSPREERQYASAKEMIEEMRKRLGIIAIVDNQYVEPKETDHD